MAGIVLEDNCHLLLRIPVSVLRQTSRPTKNPILTGIIQLGPSNVDYGLGANPNPAREGLFRKEEFHYEAQNDVYICPGNQQLHPRYHSTGGEHDRIYYGNRDACRHCELKSRCTTNPYRQVARSIDEEVLDRMETRLKANPEILRQRREIVEHPFGSIKQWMNQGAFLMRGLEKVRAEFSLTALAYNMTRVLKIVGIERLLKVFKMPKAQPFLAFIHSFPSLRENFALFRELSAYTISTL